MICTNEQSGAQESGHAIGTLSRKDGDITDERQLQVLTHRITVQHTEVIVGVLPTKVGKEVLSVRKKELLPCTRHE